MSWLSLSFTLSLIQGVLLHPQCLDGKPPFVSSPSLQFCTEYANIGCCTALEESRLKQRYDKLVRLIPSRSCHRHLKSLLCQTCSPYAAHLFNFESTGVASPTPGLCNNFCREVYDTCGAEALTHLSDDPQFEGSLQSRSQFCEYSRLSDEDYCYPDLKTNPILIDKFTIPHNDSESCMCLQVLADKHGLVTFIESNPAAAHLMYVGEQNGKIYVYTDNVRRKRLFLDLSKAVLLSKSVGDERGLLGMAFHPQFSSNQRFYLYYVVSGLKGQTVRISQWTARSNYRARKFSERVLIDIPQPYFNHNGGQLLFGDDGYLYIFTGDGGGAGDPQGNSQNLNSLMGKALRIDVNHRRRGHYTIPADNPFRGGAARPEIYAYGLRNAWRCSKDKGDPVTGEGKGRIFCGDVGQDRFEEIDIIVKGGNYGWAAREGFQCYNFGLCGSIGAEKLPIHVYDHSYGKSITGGYMYRGCEYPTLNGSYIYGDFTSGRMFKLKEKGRGWQNTEILMCSTKTCTGNWVSTYGKGITTFGTNSHGDILMSSSSDDSAFTDASTVYKLVMKPFRREDPTTCHLNEELSATSFPSEPVPPPPPPLPLSAAVTEPVLTTPDYEVSYDPYTAMLSTRQRKLAELIAQYKTLIQETETAIKEKERLIAAAAAAQTQLTTQLSPASSPLPLYSTPPPKQTYYLPTTEARTATNRKYSWQRGRDNTPGGAVVERVKSNFAVESRSVAKTTVSPYFYLQLMSTPTTRLHSRVTFTPNWYAQRSKRSTSSPLSVVTNYPLPDYLRKDGSSVRLPDIYVPPPRRLVPSDRYKVSNYYSDNLAWFYPVPQ